MGGIDPQQNGKYVGNMWEIVTKIGNFFWRLPFCWSAICGRGNGNSETRRIGSPQVPGMEVFCKDQNRVTGGVIQNGWLIGEFSEWEYLQSK
jgi:hypothetical protein